MIVEEGVLLPPKTARTLNIEAGIPIEPPPRRYHDIEWYLESELTLPGSSFYWIKVRTLTGKELKIGVEADWRISKVKERVEEKEGIEPYRQRLVFGGKQMHDDKTLEEVCENQSATSSQADSICSTGLKRTLRFI